MDIDSVDIIYVVIKSAIRLTKKWHLSCFAENGKTLNLQLTDNAVNAMFGTSYSMMRQVEDGKPKAIAFDRSGKLVVGEVATNRKPNFLSREDWLQKEKDEKGFVNMKDLLNPTKTVVPAGKVDEATADSAGAASPASTTAKRVEDMKADEIRDMMNKAAEDNKATQK